ETSPPKFSASCRGRWRAAGRVVLRLGASERDVRIVVAAGTCVRLLGAGGGGSQKRTARARGFALTRATYVKHTLRKGRPYRARRRSPTRLATAPKGQARRVGAASADHTASATAPGQAERRSQRLHP